MTAKPIVPRERDNRDSDEAIDHDQTVAGETAALGFVDALEAAFRHFGHHPASGSSRYAYELNLPGLRAWPMKRYPFLLFYMEQEGHIGLWRVLHAERHIPTWMEELESS